MAVETCAQSLQVCGFRVARLNSLGFPIAGAGNGYTSKAPIDATIVLDYLMGAQLQQLQGCGYLNAFFHAPNVLKEISLTMNITDLDSELIQLLTTPDMSVITESGTSNGIMFPAIGACAPSQQVGVSVELFTKRWAGCAQPTDGLLYWQWVIPRAFLHVTQFAQKNDFMPIPITGYANTNPNWGIGPWGDAPVAVTTVGGVFARANLPVSACGLQSVPFGAAS